MSELVVRCYECRLENGRPRRWRWLCGECARECVETHQAQTGHADVRIEGDNTATAAELASLLRRTKRITGGW